MAHLVVSAFVGDQELATGAFLVAAQTGIQHNHLLARGIDHCLGQ